MSNLKLIKLSSGEEVLANVINDGDLTIQIDEAILVAFAPDPNTGKMGIAVYPFAPSAKFPVDLDKDKVIFVAEPSEGAVKAHEQAFSRIATLGSTSGLTLPRK